MIADTLPAPLLVIGQRYQSYRNDLLIIPNNHNGCVPVQEQFWILKVLVTCSTFPHLGRVRVEVKRRKVPLESRSNNKNVFYKLSLEIVLCLLSTLYSLSKMNRVKGYHKLRLKWETRYITKTICFR